MAVIAPDSEIYLIKSPLELDNDNQLTFANATAQHNYFNSLPKVTLTNATFQRKDGTIRWPASMESVITYNYCMYRNKNYGNKWFYAFITNIEWLSNDSCAISIKTDVWQTWQFDLTFKKCFVEREHVNDDTFGLHTVPEGLEYGDYVCNGVQNVKYAEPTATTGNTRLMVAFQVTTVDVSKDSTTAVFPTPTQNTFNGIPQGCYIFGFPFNAENLGKLYTVIGYYDNAGKADAIVSIFLIPLVCSSWSVGTNGQGVFENSQDWYVPDYSTSAATALGPAITRNTTIDGYTPHNNKLFCAPYNALYLTNNAGADCSYEYEMFNGDPTFSVYAALEQGGAIKIFPLNSKKSAATATGDGWNEGLPAGKLPTLSWVSDYYLNWQAVNGTNLEIQAGLAAANWGVNMVGGMLGGASGNSNPISGMLGGTLGLADQVREIAQQNRAAEITPPQAKGSVGTGGLQFASDSSQFTFRKMSIRAEYAKIIDSYFDAYGYRVNELKIPNITGRTNWNYVHTKGCNVVGNVPQGDIEEIKAMFNRGITIWHNSTTFLDYSQSNTIVS